MARCHTAATELGMPAFESMSRRSSTPRKLASEKPTLIDIGHKSRGGRLTRPPQIDHRGSESTGSPSSVHRRSAHHPTRVIAESGHGRGRLELTPPPAPQTEPHARLQFDGNDVRLRFRLTTILDLVAFAGAFAVGVVGVFGVGVFGGVAIGSGLAVRGGGGACAQDHDAAGKGDRDGPEGCGDPPAGVLVGVYCSSVPPPGGLLLRATVPFPGLVNSESCFPADTSTSYCSQRLDRLGILPIPGEDTGVVSATTDRVCDLDGLDTAAPHLEPPACQDWQKSVTTTTGFE